jgi:hypothetical protein
MILDVDPITPDHDHAKSEPAPIDGAAHLEPPRTFSERSSSTSRFCASKIPLPGIWS